MRPLGVVLTVLGAAGLGVGLFALLDTYWRWVGVALGYPPLLSGLVGSGLLLGGIACLFTARQATPRARNEPDPDAKKAGHDSA